jgi:hypothetical protein
MHGFGKHTLIQLVRRISLMFCHLEIYRTLLYTIKRTFATLGNFSSPLNEDKMSYTNKVNHLFRLLINYSSLTVTTQFLHNHHHLPIHNSVIVILNRSPSALLFPKISRKESMASVSKMFGSVLGKNVILNSALALCKYVYCKSHLLLTVIQLIHLLQIFSVADISWCCNLTSHDNSFQHKYIYIKVVQLLSRISNY